MMSPFTLTVQNQQHPVVYITNVCFYHVVKITL